MSRRILVATALVAVLVIALYVLVRRSNTEPEARTKPRDAVVVAPPLAPPSEPSVTPTTPLDARAIDPAAAAARQERETVLASVRDSGEGHEAWEAQGTALFDAFAKRGARVTGSSCYIAGCAATLGFPSQAAYRRALDEVQASEAYLAWTGGKRLTSPELAEDGRVTVALVLYRPD
jgi:hypothetical protein